MGGLNLFASILQQNGAELYNKELNSCTLDSKLSLKAFTYWSEMYTKYKMPTTANFYNRFRIGTMPLGIEVYTQYTTLKQAAPEIDGRWAVALVPGTCRADGTVDRTVSGAGTVRYEMGYASAISVFLFALMMLTRAAIAKLINRVGK